MHINLHNIIANCNSKDSILAMTPTLILTQLLMVIFFTLRLYYFLVLHLQAQQQPSVSSTTSNDSMSSNFRPLRSCGALQHHNVRICCWSERRPVIIKGSCSPPQFVGAEAARPIFDCAEYEAETRAQHVEVLFDVDAHQV